MAEQEKLEVDKRRRKPFKICDQSRRFKGIVAESLEELKINARKSLQLNSGDDLTVFLEEDGTEVDDEEYFQFLPEQTKLLILLQFESYKQATTVHNPSLERTESEVLYPKDVTDGVYSLDARIRERITSDPAFFLSLNDDDLERVISQDPERASKELNKSKAEVILYQESCERELNRRSDLRDATDLLKLYKRAISPKNNDEISVSKKTKHS